MCVYIYFSQLYKIQLFSDFWTKLERFKYDKLVFLFPKFWVYLKRTIQNERRWQYPLKNVVSVSDVSVNEKNSIVYLVLFFNGWHGQCAMDWEHL